MATSKTQCLFPQVGKQPFQTVDPAKPSTGIYVSPGDHHPGSGKVSEATGELFRTVPRPPIVPQPIHPARVVGELGHAVRDKAARVLDKTLVFPLVRSGARCDLGRIDDETKKRASDALASQSSSSLRLQSRPERLLLPSIGIPSGDLFYDPVRFEKRSSDGFFIFLTHLSIDYKLPCLISENIKNLMKWIRQGLFEETLLNKYIEEFDSLRSHREFWDIVPRDFQIALTINQAFCLWYLALRPQADLAFSESSLSRALTFLNELKDQGDVGQNFCIEENIKHVSEKLLSFFPREE